MKQQSASNWLIWVLMMFIPMSTMGKGWKAKHVVMIGIDGWASHDFDKAPDVPNIRWMIENGSSTFSKRAVLPSASALKWASLFMGGCTEMTGYTKWNSKTPEIPSFGTNSRGIFPTIYSVIREQCPKAVTGLTFDWDGIGFVTDTAAINFVKYERGEQDEPEVAARPGIEYLKQAKPAFMTIYVGGLDAAGHGKGWYSNEYYSMLSRIDKVIGDIVQATKDAGIYEDCIFIVTSDHGGIGTGHGGITLEELETPFVAYGKNIRKGYRMKEGMMQFDTAATIAEMFGLKRPTCWRGVPMKEIFK